MIRTTRYEANNGVMAYAKWASEGMGQESKPTTALQVGLCGSEWTRHKSRENKSVDGHNVERMDKN